MILSVRDLCIGYNKSLVLENLDFSVAPGEILTILGPNGVGKTTLLKCVNRILKPGKGAVMVEDADVFRMSSAEIARRLGYVAQKSEAGRMTAFDAILLGRKPYLKWKISENDLKIVDSAVRHMGLQHLALRHIDEMSGGELQKVCIARALVQEPTVILLDEPTSSLDLKNQMEIMRTIGHVVKEHEIAAVMTMHDLNMAFRFTDKFLFLKEGKVFHHGWRCEVNPAMVEHVYGVSVDIIEHAGQILIVPR
ncbi:ABC transporter ATP-binding protein [Desulfonatronovibrio magnus]|uniref:ABC transporter ATP-binding protein n=1 Tax=Desulfonatronovibrio magnus TaxID=698827 RepID=UPI0005EBDBF6|nr:ABC transporter ATP-binding protein [Desulfonatronovibrio magnus]